VKGRGSDTRKKISLEYNPESYVLSLAESTVAHKRGRHHERFYTYLRDLRQKGKTTTAQEIIEECEITYDQLRTLKVKPETMELFTIKKSATEKNKEIWHPVIP
jgi:hypothetical protein